MKRRGALLPLFACILAMNERTGKPPQPPYVRVWAEYYPGKKTRLKLDRGQRGRSPVGGEGIKDSFIRLDFGSLPRFLFQVPEGERIGMEFAKVGPKKEGERGREQRGKGKEWERAFQE